MGVPVNPEDFVLPEDLAEQIRGRRVFITGSGKHGGLGQAFAIAAGLNGAESVGVHFCRSYSDGLETVDFINANLLEGPTPALVHWSRLSAVFLIGLKGAVLVVQMKAPSVKPAVWLNQSVCWGLCGVLSYLNEPLFKKPDFYVNVAFQTFFCAAFMAAFLTDKPKKA